MNARVIIPTWNAGPGLRELLHRLRAQEPAGLLSKIVVIDSESSDNTVKIASQAGAEIIKINKADFNHGKTRSRAAQGAQEDILVFTVQDALPENSLFLQNLLAPFSDPDVAATYARVLPRSDASALVRRDVGRDLVAGRARLYKKIADFNHYKSWPASDRRIFCHFNNVASAIRRDVFEQIPFRSLPFGEDLDFGKRALEAGHAIVYVPDAIAIHSHKSALARDFARHRDDAIIEKQLFGIVKPKSVAGALARAARMTFSDMIGSPVAFSPILRIAQSLGRWRGGATVIEG